MREEVKLGKLIEGEAQRDAQRDAIHVAVAPVVAAEVLAPGQHVGLVPGSHDTVSANFTTSIGVIDPFLKHPVLPGQRCYLCLTPGSIISLRHEWTHPAFASVKAPKPELSARADSEKWLREYAVKLSSYDTPEDAFARLIQGLKNGYLFAHGNDLHSLDELDDADQLKAHAERYLGIPINWGEFRFSCSC